MDVLYVVERGTDAFESARTTVDIPLADICTLLRDEHFGDELHPNGRGAKIIAEAVFQSLAQE